MGTIGRLKRKGDRVYSFNVAREWRKVRNEAIEAMNYDKAIVEEVRLSNFNAADEDLSVVDGGSDREAPARHHRLDLGSECQSLQVVKRENTWHGMLLEKSGNRT